MIYQTPGVYVEEFERGPRPIEGVSTSDAAFLGETERGPTNRPVLVTSTIEYLRLFGGDVGPNEFMPDAVKGFFDNGGERCYVARIVDLENAVTASLELAPRLVVRAKGEGSWGNRIAVRVDEASAGTGFRLRVAYWSREPAEIFDPFDPANRDMRPRPALTEDFDELVVDDPRSPNFVDKRIGNEGSSLIELVLGEGEDPPAPPAPGPDYVRLAGGADGEPVQVGDYVGGSIGDTALAPEDRRGLSRLEDPLFREIALVYAPGAAEVPGLVDAIITHCELNRFRFAILDAPQNARVPSELQLGGAALAELRPSEYAAVYFPWIVVIDGLTGNRKVVPPGGHVAGIYARSDATRGVWKAPANEIVRGAIDLVVDVNDRDHGVINPRGINAIRAFPGRGILVWGARTLADNALWKYINVRRLFIFLEASIFRATQWVVFEPNDERLWVRVEQTITLFLRAQWRAGAMMGTKEEEAFYVEVGRSTMTQDDILNGRLIAEIGIAPVRPAEFVVFRFTQITQAPKQ